MERRNKLGEQKINLNELTVISVADAALDLFKKSKGDKVILDTPEGYHIQVEGQKGALARQGSQSLPTVNDEVAFSEAYQYLENAKKRFDTKSAPGYSDCKVNCRHALVSILKVLTGKEDTREAVRELGKRGILGKREQELIESFADLLAKLYGLVSKEGAHPPMTREEDDAKLALGVTTSIISYITNQATRQRV